MDRSYVVTGGGRGIGRAIVEYLLAQGDTVVTIELDEAALAWTPTHPAGPRVIAIIGNAADEAIVAQAADRAEKTGVFSGWVNNAALFRDIPLHSSPSQEVIEAIGVNLNPVIVGCSVAIRRFLAAGTGGKIVNISSHQAQRAVRGALPYVTAKAAIEGITRALAVDYGPYDIRVNAVALGSITTERYETFLQQQTPAETNRIEDQLRKLHPLGRIGKPSEVAKAVGFLLSDEASFINGAILPVDGGRSVYGPDPEERDPINSPHT